jgi:hypothetical protein
VKGELPVAVAVAVPSQQFWQDAFAELVLTVGPPKLLIVHVVVAVQPLASVTINV